ncbi:hypothetical protein UlMin_026406 [Ulmus minor]
MEDRVKKLKELVGTLAVGLSELNTGQNDFFAHIIERVEKLSQQVFGKSHGDIGENSNNRFRVKTDQYSPQKSRGSFSNFIPKTVKLDFPKYEGSDDPTKWLCKAKKYFVLHEIAESDKVTLASFYLDGDADLWFQMLEQELLYVTWKDFKNGIISRFGPNQFEDHFGELIKLRQTSSVVEYQSKFERLLAKVGSLAPEKKVSCFLT